MTIVNVYVYPLHGAVYHSQVEVFHKEYSYSMRGIEHFNVGDHDYGEPIQSHYIGRTSKSRETFLTKLDDLVDGRFRADRYNVLQNNCNDFADFICKYLCNVGIPANILIPQQVGRAVAPPFFPFLSGLSSGSSGSSSGSRRRNRNLYRRGDR